MSTAPSAGRRAAENALWHALEERRDAVRTAGLGFSERQHHQFREAHAAGNLIGERGTASESYTGGADPYYLRPMAQVIKSGLPTWEDVLIRRGESWTRYVTPGARRGARRAIADATSYIPFL